MAPESSESPEASPWAKGRGEGSPTEHLSNLRPSPTQSHTCRMRYILLALFVVGCGGSTLPVEGQTDWSVTLGNWETPTCEGTMKLAPNPEVEPRGTPPMFVGTWTCGSFGQKAWGDILQDGRVFLTLETTPGSNNGVRGTLADDDAIAGDILLDGNLVSFATYRQ